MNVANFLFRNWPLKLGAILLASVLYAGLVLGQNVRTWEGTVPVDTIREPTGVTLINQLAPVTQIRYRAPVDFAVLSPELFRASVDLSDVEAEAGGPPVAAPITLIALDQRIQIVDFEPREVQVHLDPVEEREMPVIVRLLPYPDSVTVGTEQLEPATVTLRGASSRVSSVASVVASVSIDASALNVDRDVLVVPLDANGNEVPSVVVEPARVRVRIPVAEELSNRTLPVVPQLIGSPAPGYRVTSVSVEPQVMTVSGDAAVVSQLQNVPTNTIDISGRTTDLEAEVAVALPTGATPSQADRVRVMLTIEEEASTRTFQAGVRLDNEAPDFGYVLSVPQVNVTLGGPQRALAAANGSDFVVSADVGRLLPGVHVVPLQVDPPDGLELVSTDPASVAITVSQPQTAPPSASP